MARRLVFCVLFFGWMACVAQQQPTSKMSVALTQRLYNTPVSDSVDILLVKSDPLQSATNAMYRVLNKYHNTFTIRIPAGNVISLLTDKQTLFIDVVKIPKEELTTGSLDLAANTLNIAHARFPTITGSGILASIKEQQFDTMDIDYTDRYVNTAAAAPAFSTHAAIMATTLAGAGNSSPFAYGAAPGAFVTSTSFASLLPEEDSYYKHFKITIQNHSYGTVPENNYGAEAAAYDESVAVNPTLLHIFSAGNSGTEPGTGPYTSLQGYANLTGNFKTAKNIIVVGSIDSFYHVAAASSKGPTFDGRIKPELVAFGEDGSSGAAALTSGTAALLQQAYQNIKHTLPSAALVKAVLLNSASDVAQKGLDYASGYGCLNGYDALKAILQNRFLEDSLTYGVLKKFDVTVPPNTAQLKLTLAWTDAPAQVNATTALVNDLDLALQSNTGEMWLPWVLNAAPNLDSITKLAVRQRDTLNNVEQITVDAPTPGRYTIQVKGSRMSTAAQAFALAYQFDTTAFEWTFPTKNDPVIAGKSNVLRWQAAQAATGAIEYTTGNKNWKLLADNVHLAEHYFKWNAPDTLTTARLRMRLLNTAPVLSDTFIISKAPLVQVGFNCTDSFLLFWNSVSAAQYQVFNLKNGTLQPIATTPDTAIILKKSQQQSNYYSVAPVIAGRAGLKSFTIDYAMQGTACYFRSFYAVTQDATSATFAALLGTDYGIISVSFQKLKNNQFVTLQTINRPSTITFTFIDTQLAEGGNRYRLQLLLHSGAVITSEEISIFQFPNDVVFIYPNPARSGERLTIRTNTGEHIRLRIFNATGALVQQRELNSIITTLSATALPAGIYFIQALKDDGTRRATKLVVY